MKKVFIAYADDNMSYSLKRIGRQAKSLGIFDDILLWTPRDLPQYCLDSPLMKYQRGGGYWAWKPVIIHETLQKYEEGTIVVYIDAGCTLKKGAEWQMFFRLMEQYEAICFQYPPTVEVWEKLGCASTKIKHWTKKGLLDFFDHKFKDGSYHNYLKIWGGGMFFRGKNNSLLQEWFNIYQQYPELIIDPSEEEKKTQNKDFVAHRHDQSVITPLAYYNSNVLVLPEFMENYGEDSIIFVSRIRAKNLRQFVVLRIKYYLRKWLGDKLFEAIKRKLTFS